MKMGRRGDRWILRDYGKGKGGNWGNEREEQGVGVKQLVDKLGVR